MGDSIPTLVISEGQTTVVEDVPTTAVTVSEIQPTTTTASSSTTADAANARPGPLIIDPDTGTSARVTNLDVPLSATIKEPISPSKLYALHHRTDSVISSCPIPDDIRFNPLDVEGLREDSETLDGNAIVCSRPVHLRAENLSYSISMGKGEKKTEKKILQNLNCVVRPGQVMAILGSSGAGKTSFLNLLAGRLTYFGESTMTGTLLVNGQKRDMSEFRKTSAYVLQQDTLFATLTVYETISLSAFLRLPREMTKEEKIKRINDIIVELGLKKCRDTYIGDDVMIRGISGGERKRACIGVELVTDPSLLFLDEPTSGLDSFNAQNVVLTMLKLAQGGRTVICTVHQPRSSIYQMFDMLMLLSEGKQMYFGEAADAVKYFEGVGFHTPKGFNPADYFIDLISFDGRSPLKEKTTRKRIDYLEQKFQEHWAKTKPAIDKESEQRAYNNLHSNESSNKLDQGFATSFLTQLGLLSLRSLRMLPRNKATNGAQIGQLVVFSLLLGLIWLNQGSYSDGNSIRAIAGVLFFILVNQSFSVTFGILFLFPVERAVVLKERAARSYKVAAYFISKSVSEFPRTAVICLVFSIVTYFMVDLRTGGDYFFTYFVIILLIQLCSEGMAYIVSALALDAQQAGAIAPVFIITSMLFAGFFIGTNSIPVWLRWIQWISFLKYGFAAIMQNEFNNRDLSYLNCASTPTFCPLSGQAVLEQYGLTAVPMYGNILVLVAMAVGFRVIAYCVLRFLRGPKFNTRL